MMAEVLFDVTIPFMGPYFSSLSDRRLHLEVADANRVKEEIDGIHAATGIPLKDITRDTLRRCVARYDSAEKQLQTVERMLRSADGSGDQSEIRLKKRLAHKASAEKVMRVAEEIFDVARKMKKDSKRKEKGEKEWEKAKKTLKKEKKREKMRLAKEQTVEQQAVEQQAVEQQTTEKQKTDDPELGDLKI